MLKRLEQWFFPNLCCICGMETVDLKKTGRYLESKSGQDLCTICRASLPWREEGCYRCGLETIFGRDSIYCQNCVSSPPEFDRLCSLFSYDLPVSKLITSLKFGGQLAYGRVLGELLAEAVLQKWYQDKPLPQAIMPVPLHTKRLQQRGFNQATELLWPFIKEYPMPVLLKDCIRSRNTKAQSELNRAERIQNLSTAFEVVKPIPYQHIAVIDDVVTTGSTVNALCKVLKDSGVFEIDVWCICRAGN